MCLSTPAGVPHEQSESDTHMVMVLGNACPNLEQLEVSATLLVNILQLLRVCVRLWELDLHGGCMTTDDVTAILAFPQINRLTAHHYADQGSTDVCSLARALDLRPDLEYLRLNRWVGAPAEGTVHLIVVWNAGHCCFGPNTHCMLTCVNDLRAAFPDYGCGYCRNCGHKMP